MILDEAQMVEKTVTNVNKMALRFSSSIKWCVTGTPMSDERGLIDFYGLFKFLAISPFNDENIFKKLIINTNQNDNSLLYNILSNIFHRNQKKWSWIAEELNIPEKNEYYVGLQFSVVESQYYNRLVNNFKNQINDKKINVKKMS